MSDPAGCACPGCRASALSDRPLCPFCDDAPGHLHCPACGRPYAEYLRVQEGSPRGLCGGCGIRLSLDDTPSPPARSRRRCRGCWSLLAAGAPTCAACRRKVDLLEEGATLQFRRNDLDRALEVYRRALDIDPDYPDVLANIGILHAMRGQIEEGLRFFDRAVAAAPLDPEIRFNRARARRLLDRREAAHEDLAVALEVHPATIEDAIVRGDGIARAAIDDFLSRPLDERDARALCLRGTARQMQGDLEGAARDYAAAIERRPSHAEALFRMATLRHLQRDGTGARDLCTRALERNPRLYAAWHFRGLLAEMDSRPEDAAADYEKALEWAPRNWPETGAIEAALARPR